MHNILVITKRELRAYFTSPIAYVFLIIFLLLSGFFSFMLGSFFDRGEASLSQSFFVWHPWLWLFLVPAVGMRLWSEEQRMGTMELLATMPIHLWQAVIGKYIASLAVLAVALVLTFPMVITVAYLGDPDYGPILTGYFGSLLIASTFLAITCVTSAISRDQVVSFILALVVCLLLILCGFPPVTDLFTGYSPFIRGVVDLVASFSVVTHFEPFQRGVVDFRHLFFFLSATAFGLYSTSVILRSHRA